MELRRLKNGKWQARMNGKSVTWTCYTGNPFEALRSMIEFAYWPSLGAPGAFTIFASFWAGNN